MTDHRETLNYMYSLNTEKIEKFKRLSSSLDKIESNIKNKIEYHRKYIETLRKNLKETSNLQHNICKNLIKI